MKLIKHENKKYDKSFTFDLGRPIKDQKHLTIRFYSQDAGYNYLTYQQNRKGYVVSITPETVTIKNGYTTIETTAFSGVKTQLKEVKRFSQKSFDDCLSVFAEELLTKLCDYVGFETTEDEIRKICEIVADNWGGRK